GRETTLPFSSPVGFFDFWISRARAPAPHRSISSPKTARPGSSSCFSCNMGNAIARASGPASRTTPIPPRPEGVAIATIVSSRFNESILFHYGAVERREASLPFLVKSPAHQYNQHFLLWLTSAEV